MSTRTMIATGASIRMRPAEYERKVRLAVGGPLSRDERATAEMHADMGTPPEQFAKTLLVLRKIDERRRAMREADEMYDRQGAEL